MNISLNFNTLNYDTIKKIRKAITETLMDEEYIDNSDNSYYGVSEIITDELCKQLKIKK
jgi:predicted double-glycine peptidase